MTEMRQLNFEDYVDILRRRWWLVAALALLGAGAGYGTAHFLPKRYTSQTLVLVEQPTVPGDYVKPVITQDVNQRLATMQPDLEPHASGAGHSAVWIVRQGYQRRIHRGPRPAPP